MSWNYRVLRYAPADSKFAPYVYGIHEVYYDEQGAVKGWTEEPVAALGLDEDDLKWRLGEMLSAFDKTVLDYGSNPAVAEQNRDEGA